MRAWFAIPGDLQTPSGGYAYARRLLRLADRAGLTLEHVPLPGGFPLPSADALAETAAALGALAADRPLLIDGLAYGALPDQVIAAARGPIVALCHHPLALETGLPPETAAHLRRTEMAALAQAQHVITTSQATAEILRRDYAVPGERLTVAPPGTDPAPRALVRSGPGCRLLAVGSVTPRKDHARLVRALAEMVDLDWSLRIVGPAPDPAALAALRMAIDEAGLAERVELAGPYGAAALTAAYQSADLFVLASVYEGFGMAFTEAMSHGLPTLGLACPAVEEATAGGACLVPREAFAAALRALVADPARRAALAERCWRAAQTFLRWPQTVTIVAGALREAAG